MNQTELHGWEKMVPPRLVSTLKGMDLTNFTSQEVARLVTQDGSYLLAEVGIEDVQAYMKDAESEILSDDEASELLFDTCKESNIRECFVELVTGGMEDSLEDILDNRNTKVKEQIVQHIEPWVFEAIKPFLDTEDNFNETLEKLLKSLKEKNPKGEIS